MADRIEPYLCDLHRTWLAGERRQRWRELHASLLLFDITGFTPLTERLARAGKAGVEQLISTLDAVVAPLVDVAAALGGDTLKFGGDALLVLFEGEGHERRAGAAAHDMQAALASYRRTHTAAGVVSLRASAAVVSGSVTLFLAGDRFDELVVAGPAVSEVAGLERDAEPGKVLLGRATSAALSAACCGATGIGGPALLVARPAAAAPLPRQPVPEGDPRRGLPAALHDHLGPHAESEHRLVTVAFAQFRGLDELLARDGAAAAAEELHALITRAQRACGEHGVTFLGTDADIGAGKIFAVSGAPTASTDDEDRMLFAMREIVCHSGDLRVRAGVARGRAFVVHLGTARRRSYTAMGAPTNLAARVMGRAPDGAVLATRAVLDHARAPWSIQGVTPFVVRGRTEPVDAGLVGEPRVAATRPVAESPLVGREGELRILRDALSAARGGEGRLVELVAEPGMGKTRLLAELVAESSDGDLRRVVVEGGAYGTSAPYLALQAPLRRLLGADDDSERALGAALAAAVERHLPDAAALLALIGIPFGLELPATEESARVSPQLARGQVHQALDRLLAALLPAGRTLLIVEDAHWIDDASSDLLHAVLGRAGERGWAAFVTRRPVAGGLELDVVDERIELGPLPDQAAHALVVAAAGGDGARLAPHVAAALVERSHGNPFFLRELVSAARDGADLEALPATVEALLIARLDTLVPADRRLLRRAAVLGRRFPLSWLRGMLAVDVDVDESELRVALARLDAFLEVESGVVRFRHVLQREAAYEALPYERRRTLHACAGELIEREEDAGERADILALHFLRAQDHERAWRYGLAAAKHARARYAHADAAQLYRRALEAGIALGLPATELGDVYEALGDAHSASSELERANEAFTRARRLVAGDPLRESRLMQRQARAAMDGAQVVRAARWLLRALRTIDGLDGRPALVRRAMLHSELAGVRARQGRMKAAIKLCEQAIANAEAGGVEADSALAHACYILDWALVELGRGAEAVHSPRALEIYRAAGDLDREAVVLNNLGMFAYYDGRWDEAVQLYRAGAQASGRAGNVRSAAYGDCNIGELRSDQGRGAEARPLLVRARDTWRATGYEQGVAFAIALLGRLEARTGDVWAAQAQLREALELFHGLHLSPDALWVEALIPEALVFAGEADAALAEVERLLDVAGAGRLGPLLMRVRGIAWAQLGLLDQARGALEAAIAAARDRGDEFDLFVSVDAAHALDLHEGATDEERRRERDDLAKRLEIVKAPPVPLAAAGHAATAAR